MGGGLFVRVIGGMQSQGQLFFKNLERQVNHAFSYDNHDVHGRPDVFLYPAKNLPDFALGIISHHRFSDFSGGDDPQPFMLKTIVQPEDRADIVHFFLPAMIHHIFKLTSFEQSLVLAKRSARPFQTASRFLPFLLLLDRTFLPPALAILARNPCVLFLLVFDG